MSDGRWPLPPLSPQPQQPLPLIHFVQLDDSGPQVVSPVSTLPIQRNNIN